ncbi:hypothetical protein FQZ97_1022020 [compost metagenome]
MHGDAHNAHIARAGAAGCNDIGRVDEEKLVGGRRKAHDHHSDCTEGIHSILRIQYLYAIVSKSTGKIPKLSLF